MLEDNDDDDDDDVDDIKYIVGGSSNINDIAIRTNTTWEVLGSVKNLTIHRCHDKDSIDLYFGAFAFRRFVELIVLIIDDGPDDGEGSYFRLLCRRILLLSLFMLWWSTAQHASDRRACT